MAVQQPLLSEKLHSTLLSILENGWENTGGSELCRSKKPTSPFSLLERNLLEILVLLFCILPEEVSDIIAIYIYSDYCFTNSGWMSKVHTMCNYTNVMCNDKPLFAISRDGL